MPELTEEQEEFLEKFLKLGRKSDKKGMLGGKSQNAKIRESFEDFIRRRDKVLETVTELKKLKGGESRAAPFELAVKDVEKKITQAQQRGDETIIKDCYEELEAAKKGAYKELEARAKELDAILKDEQKFHTALEGALGETNQGKKTEKLQKVKEICQAWLGKHASDDSANVWTVYQKAVKEGGGATADDLPLVMKQVDAELFDLQKQSAILEKRGSQRQKETLGDELDSFKDRLTDYLELATEADNKTAMAQLPRLIERVEAEMKKLGVTSRNGEDEDGSESSDVLVESSTGESSEESSEKDKKGKNKDKSSTGVSSEESSEEDNKGKGKDKVEDKEKPKEPTNEEKAKASFAQADELIKNFQKEVVRVKKVVNDLDGEVTQLTNTVPANGPLKVDLKMLATAIADAKKSLGFAEFNLERAEKELEEGIDETEEMEWKLSVRKIAAELEKGQNYLASTEKATGTAEGGLVYIKSAVERMNAMTKRLTDIDEELMAKVKEKVELLPLCDPLPVKDEAEKDLARQLVFVSGLARDKITTALGAPATGKTPQDKKKKFDVMVQLFIKGPQLSTQAMTEMLADCQQLLVDADRFFGNWDKFKATQQGPLKAKADQVKAVAQQDVNKYTVPVIVPDPNKGPSKFDSVGVAIVGGGPVGLMAAIEARMSGAKVHVYEGRQDPYSRMNVLKLNEQAEQRFRRAGIFKILWPNGYDWKVGAVASVKDIENALEGRATGLGIKLQRGLFLKDVTKSEDGKTLLHFKGQEDKPLECDLLIVATGGSVANAQKYADNVVLGDKLGIPFQKSKVRDFAGVGLFDPESEKTGHKTPTEGWLYDFATDQAKYIVSQLTEEEYEKFSKDPKALRERLAEDAMKANVAKEGSEFIDHGGKESSSFPIDIQQAQKFTSEDKGAVLIGDSGATPHPSTSLGLNTGVAETGPLQDLIKGLGEDDPQDPQARKEAMQKYEWEVKRRTDVLVAKGFEAMENSAKYRITPKLWTRMKATVDGIARSTEVDRVEQALDTYLGTLSTKPEDIEEDRDWSLRENSIKEIRSFEKDIRETFKAIEDYLAGDLTNVTANAKQQQVETLLKQHIPGS